METKLIKIDGYWIVVSLTDAEHYDWSKFHISDFTNGSSCLAASQNPAHNLPTITFSDEVAKELGVVDFWEGVPVKWVKYSWKDTATMLYNCLKGTYGKEFDEWVEAKIYNQCLSDNADKKFTLEDISKFRKILEEGSLTNMSCSSAIVEFDKFIQLLTKQEYFCELEMERYKQRHGDGRQFIMASRPEITNNSIKVKRIWK